MTRTGYINEQGQTIFPENSTPLEVCATVQHLNGSNLAAAKMYLEVILGEFANHDSNLKKAIDLISISIDVERHATKYAYENFKQ